MRTISRKLNMAPGGIPVVIKLNQYDSDYSLVFELYSTDGVFTVPSGSTAKICGTKRSGTGYSADASISGTTVTITGDVQMTAAAGTNVYEIVLYNGTKKLHTSNIILLVERAALDADTITDETIVPELDSLAQYVAAAQESARSAAESAAEIDFRVDPTLSQSGQAADAKVVGNKFVDTDNLLNLWSYTKNGLTLKATSKSSFTIDGTATSGVFANDPTGADKTANKFALEAGEYTFALEQENGDAVPSTMYWCFGTTPTSAVKNISNKQTITFPDTVYVYLRLANSGDTYTDLNIVASIVPGKRQGYTPKQSAIDVTAQKIVREYTLSPVPFESYPDDTKSNATGYVNDFVYPSGYIKNIKTKLNDVGSITILLVSANNKTVLRKFVASGSGVIIIGVYEYISEPFYIVTYGENASFFRTTYATNYLNFTYSFSSNLKTAGEGDVIAFEFSEKTASTNVVSIAQQVVYGNLKESSDNNGKTRIIRKMLVAGDSITAGYPNYTEGAHWWEAVARAYGLTATLAAQTGSGFSYYNGTNACKIAHNTDFSAYDMAVFAFGTNDYGNNISLGTIDDSYTYSEDSSQTFYACIKYVIDKIKTDNPKCAVVISMPINRVRMSNQSTPAGTQSTKWAYGHQNGQGHTLSDYCDAIKAVCDKYCIPYIDHRNGAFDVYAVASTDVLGDGLHPSEYGYKLLGAEMTARFGAIIQPYIT